MDRLKRRRALPRGLPLPLGRARPAEWAQLTPSLPAPPRAVLAARSPVPAAAGSPGAAAMGRARPTAQRSHSPDPAAQPAPPRSRARTLALLGALVAAVAAAAAARACALLADAQAAARQVGGDRRGTVHGAAWDSGCRLRLRVKLCPGPGKGDWEGWRGQWPGQGKVGPGLWKGSEGTQSRQWMKAWM